MLLNKKVITLVNLAGGMISLLPLSCHSSFTLIPRPQYVHLYVPLAFQQKTLLPQPIPLLKFKKFLDLKPAVSQPGEAIELELFFPASLKRSQNSLNKQKMQVPPKKIQSCRSYLHHSTLGWMPSLKNSRPALAAYYKTCTALGILNYARPIRKGDEKETFDLSQIHLIPAGLYDFFYQSPFSALNNTGASTIQGMVDHQLIKSRVISEKVLELKSNQERLILKLIARANFTSHLQPPLKNGKTSSSYDEVLVLGTLENLKGEILEENYLIFSLNNETQQVQVYGINKNYQATKINKR